MEESEKYTVTVQIYKVSKEVYNAKDFIEALHVQKGASIMAKLLNWTRHSSCDDIVRHMDYIQDSYNEGCITVKRIN